MRSGGLLAGLSMKSNGIYVGGVVQASESGAGRLVPAKGRVSDKTPESGRTFHVILPRKLPRFAARQREWATSSYAHATPNHSNAPWRRHSRPKRDVFRGLPVPTSFHQSRVAHHGQERRRLWTHGAGGCGSRRGPRFCASCKWATWIGTGTSTSARSRGARARGTATAGKCTWIFLRTCKSHEWE